ncbi:hypothetical protein FOPG_19686 [Fusarium oxysporum f. sp. conglutinans race 2 54008]|uniref:Uncharacterized protein n=2 Tax=Fusarium oxysporum f. sp. conglutinans TaxID=100902 RepID=A0A8H6GG39_FUSOX|nr:hypothetical protein FOPG_19686 [Fusarium oxysporum f. sp. conglutinans race 2 54008]KAF6517527.1 hypothetical protein HZS61_003088 [Fusarium oxysporum f. sp. conglutinans]KAG6989451.1 hypothetical protein FocnCong_v020978 [Fusarium oxysporum f. sp. conglutinans]KAI8404307.1 hypothetical protein FOFC_15802 [Fusarium oxysporum]KAK2471125.1 hypothetical protein H9L39_17356 [Fusarium oxysporum f. sp. albedinis]
MNNIVRQLIVPQPVPAPRFSAFPTLIDFNQLSSPPLCTKRQDFSEIEYFESLRAAIREPNIEDDVLAEVVYFGWHTNQYWVRPSRNLQDNNEPCAGAYNLMYKIFSRLDEDWLVRGFWGYGQ